MEDELYMPGWMEGEGIPEACIARIEAAGCQRGQAGHMRPPVQPDGRARLIMAMVEVGWPLNAAEEIAAFTFSWWEA